MQKARLAWGLWGLGFAVFVAAEALVYVNRVIGEQRAIELDWLFIVMAFGFATLGALILSQHPGHAIGWLVYTVGVLFEISFLATGYAIWALMTDPGVLPFGREAAVLSLVGGTAFFLMTSLLFLLFPDGRPISPRWNIVLMLALVAIVLGSGGEVFRPGALDAPLEAWDNPAGLRSAEDVVSVLGSIGFALVVICGLAGATSLVIRFRNSTGIQREQLKWVAFAGVVFILFWIIGVAGEERDLFDGGVQNAFILIGISLIPLAAAIAVLRYRLYDIDWIISRTLVYVPLTAILAGIYIALTGVFRAIVTDSTGDNSDFAIAMTTVIVVAMLTPVKNYLQERVDKRFKDSSDPAKQLQKLSRETRTAVEVLDRQRLLQRFLETSTAIMEAEGGLIRLEDGRQVFVTGEWRGEADVMCTLLSDGQTLGSLCIARRKGGRPYSQMEEQALQEAADVVAYLISLRQEAASKRDKAQ